MFFRALGWVLLLPAVALAEAPAGTHRVSAGLASVSYASFFRGTGAQLAGEVSWAHAPSWLPAGMEVGAGLRGAAPRAGVVLPLEAFGSLRLVGQLGPWRPFAGPELGLSGLARLSPRADKLPEDLDRMEAERLSPLYVSFEVAPLRFEFGRFTVSALQLSVGSTLFPSGTATRMDLQYLEAGFAL